MSFPQLFGCESALRPLTTIIISPTQGADHKRTDPCAGLLCASPVILRLCSSRGYRRIRMTQATGNISCDSSYHILRYEVGRRTAWQIQKPHTKSDQLEPGGRGWNIYLRYPCQ